MQIGVLALQKDVYYHLLFAGTSCLFVCFLLMTFEGVYLVFLTEHGLVLPGVLHRVCPVSSSLSRAF
jgi:hypothetical protein